MSMITQSICELLKAVFLGMENKRLHSSRSRHALQQHWCLLSFTCKKKITVNCDALQLGLGAEQLQDRQLLAYASRAFTDIKICTI